MSYFTTVISYNQYGVISDVDLCCNQSEWQELEEAKKHAKSHLNHVHGPWHVEVMNEAGKTVWHELIEAPWYPDEEDEA